VAELRQESSPLRNPKAFILKLRFGRGIGTNPGPLCVVHPSTHLDVAMSLLLDGITNIEATILNLI